MNINSLIISTLQPLGVPVSRTHTGTETTYITFFEFNQRSHMDADDAELKTCHSMQVDIWSKGDYIDLVKQVKERLIEVGFTRSMETEQYEDEIKTYHKIIRFNFVQ